MIKMANEDMLAERRKYNISPSIKMTPKEEQVVIEYAKWSNILNKRKEQHDHIILVECDDATYKLLKASGWNIYPDRKRGFTGKYLCDVVHTIPHK